MSKKHRHPIPPDLLRDALELLGFRIATPDPQQALIELLDNYRLPQELHEKTKLPSQSCRRVLHLRDIATGGRCNNRN